MRVFLTKNISCVKMELIYMDINSVGDNLVGFLSQIGWTKEAESSPAKKISMEKIFLDFDTNGGNGQNVAITEILFKLHNKIPHREIVMQQVCTYLNE